MTVTEPSPKDEATSVVSHLTNGTNDNASIYSKTRSLVSQSLSILRGEPVTTTSSDNHNASSLETFELAQKTLSFRSMTSEKDNIPEKEASAINFLQDDPKDMTYGRRIALKHMDKAWYNPALKKEEESSESEEEPNNPYVSELESLHSHSVLYEANAVTTAEQPSLARAWAYFEHVTLPRYTVEESTTKKEQKNVLHRAFRKVFCKANKEYQRAEPGEKHLPTKLYDPLFTPLKQMGDFGLGIGLYFSTLRAISILCLVAGLINIPNFIYFSGDDYSSSQSSVPTLQQGSAICTDTVWVPCLDCDPDDFTDHRIANGTHADSNTTLVFALRNDCDGATLQQGMVNFGTLLFVLLGIVLMNRYQKRMEVAFDEDEQTAQDYSIVISNPPPDATQPDEWRRFFEDNFDKVHVTCCTVAVDNDFLVRSLVERRECMRSLEMKLPPGTPTDTLTLARIAAQIERDRSILSRIIAMMAPGIPELFGRATILTARVQGLAQQDYPATNVFLTFETEAAQRNVLQQLTVGSVQAKRNKTHVVAPHCLFRGQHVLMVHEPDEPSTVRWDDLNVKFWAKLKQLLYTTIATVCAIVLIAFIIKLVNDKSAAFAAFAIAIFNGAFPALAKILTNLESHAAEGGKQTSLYFKIAAFRWVNTAIVITIITSFTDTLEKDGLINSIFAIFFAEIVTTNAIQLGDPVGHLQRHFLAPRAATQDLMNLNMQGTVFELAERYTNMTKILFLCLWYCSIFPGAFFLCSFTLLVNFFVDRFSLMRTWARAPQLGTRISKFSRRYFFSTAIVAMAVVSAYYWSGFPYDNLCENDSSLADALNGADVPDNAIWEITTQESTNATEISLSIGEPTYRYCLQDLYRTEGRNFPAISRFQPEGSEWMTDEQETLTNIYGWTSVAVLAIVALKFLWGWAEEFYGMFRRSYEPTGEDQGIAFSDVPSISTYIPQVKSAIFSYPLLACKIDGIDAELFDWTDPDKPYSYYDLTKDADRLVKGMNLKGKHVFSVLKHWPPEEKKENGLSKTVSADSERTNPTSN